MNNSSTSLYNVVLIVCVIILSISNINIAVALETIVSDGIKVILIQRDRVVIDNVDILKKENTTESICNKNYCAIPK